MTAAAFGAVGSRDGQRSKRARSLMSDDADEDEIGAKAPRSSSLSMAVDPSPKPVLSVDPRHTAIPERLSGESIDAPFSRLALQSPDVGSAIHVLTSAHAPAHGHGASALGSASSRSSAAASSTATSSSLILRPMLLWAVSIKAMRSGSSVLIGAAVSDVYTGFALALTLHRWSDVRDTLRGAILGKLETTNHGHFPPVRTLADVNVPDNWVVDAVARCALEFAGVKAAETMAAARASRRLPAFGSGTHPQSAPLPEGIVLLDTEPLLRLWTEVKDRFGTVLSLEGSAAAAAAALSRSQRTDFHWGCGNEGDASQFDRVTGAHAGAIASSLSTSAGAGAGAGGNMRMFADRSSADDDNDIDEDRISTPLPWTGTDSASASAARAASSASSSASSGGSSAGAAGSNSVIPDPFPPTSVPDLPVPHAARQLTVTMPQHAQLGWNAGVVPSTSSSSSPAASTATAATLPLSAIAPQPIPAAVAFSSIALPLPQALGPNGLPLVPQRALASLCDQANVRAETVSANPAAGPGSGAPGCGVGGGSPLVRMFTYLQQL